MASLLISPVIEIFRWSLQPVAPFTWFGFPISTLDVVATFRLCIVLRQVREIMQVAHTAKKSEGEIEEQSFAKRLATTLLVVYGGEAITGTYSFKYPTILLGFTLGNIHSSNARDSTVIYGLWSRTCFVCSRPSHRG